VCSTAQFLQVLVDAVDQLLDETTTANGTSTTSFNSLEKKLETLLTDSVGGTPHVNLTTTSDANRSDLMVDIILAWDWTEQFLINVDLDTLMKDENTTGDIGNFAKNLVPGEGSIKASLGTGVSFRLGVGLEYDKRGKKINPYILGTRHNRFLCRITWQCFWRLYCASWNDRRFFRR